MIKFKKVIKKILFPKLWIIVLSSLIGFPMVIISLNFFDDNSPLSYISYILSAYALTVLCTNFPRFKRRCKELVHGNEVYAIVAFRNFMNKYKYTSLYLNSREFRAKVSLCSGLAVNILFAVFKCATGIMFRSAWLWTIGIYYAILGAIRFTLLKNVRITDEKELSKDRKIYEYKSTKTCGIMMLSLNIAMTGMAIQMIFKNRSYEYKGYIIYISAAYTFYCLITAVVNVVKFSKINNPILSAAKILSLASALMSIFALQTAMFSSFGGGADFQQRMNAITGGMVCFSVIGMAVFMILRANKNLKTLAKNI